MSEEEKTLQEMAKATGKAVEALRDAGSFLADVFGGSLKEIGGTAADWARYYRYKNQLMIMDKVRQIHHERQIEGGLKPIPLEHILPIMDGASLEQNEDIQLLWANLIANATDPEYNIDIRKVFIEILRGLEPLDAQILELLSDPNINKKYGAYVEATLNAEEISEKINADPDDVKISLQTLDRYSCIIDSWENTSSRIESGYSGFRVNNPSSNFRLSHLGELLVELTKSI